MMISQLLKNAAIQLSQQSDSAALDAEILLAYVLNCSRASLRARYSDSLSNQDLQQFHELVARRMKGEPVAYIVGRKEFWSLELSVKEGALIPRPDTELLIETALELFPDVSKHLIVADLGTGSGAIALALASERKMWEIYAVDNSEIALSVAVDNAQRLQLPNVSFCLGNWFTALPVKTLDLVVSNPPYLSEQEWPRYASGLQFEPRAALVAADNGLSAFHEIASAGGDYLRAGGYLLVEHGFAQGQAVREIFVAAGYENVRTIRDLAGHERVTVGRR